MQGVIYVEEYMEREHRLQDWLARRQRDVEWIALREYWRASDDDKHKVKVLYGATLVKGLLKHNQDKLRV